MFEEIAAPDGTPNQTVAPSARLPRFVGTDHDSAEVLRRLRVAVVGAGGVGRVAAVGLARLHPAALWLIDPGCYKPESLLTQAIHPNEVGLAKAHSTARLCKAVSPRTRVFAFAGGVEELPPSALVGAGAVVLATDNLAAEVRAGQLCLWLSKPLAQGSVHGETLVAQVRHFLRTGPDRACPACGFGAAEWADLNRETVFSCEGGASRRTLTRPTTGVSSLCGLAGDLLGLTLLRHTLGLGAPPGDGLIEWCAYTGRTAAVALHRDPECPCDHRAWELEAPPAPLADCTLTGLAQRAGIEAQSFAVEGHAFVERAVCRGCGRPAAPRRFLPAGGPARACPGCGGELRPEPFYRHDAAPAEVLGPLAGRPLRELVAGRMTGVLVRGDERTVMYCAPQAADGETTP